MAENVNEEVIDEEKVKEEEKTYTQEDVDALQAQIDELKQYKPEEKGDEEKQLQEKAENLWKKQIDLELKSNGLEVFKDFINVDVDDTETLESQISKLKEIVSGLELSNTYQPTDHKSIDAYSIARKNRDTKSMISEKLKS